MSLSPEQEPDRETLAGRDYSPRTDIPFGKPFQMGLAVYTISDRAIENGYRAGIDTHKEYIRDHQNGDPVMLDDEQFLLVLKACTPAGLSERTTGLWRAHFIAGWTSVYLAVAVR